MTIEVKKPTQQELNSLGVTNWPIWEKEESSFDWYYDQKEVCYFLEGDVTVRTPDGKEVKMQKGDLVSFPKGLKCKWQINRKVKKHYNFE
ncbi:MAG: cupin domain-containing protein [Candidatus Omnitrophota bacterium]|nr:MAG: cupin domain-containing protein [Candidatus Omnitrophota bacterium]